MERFVHTMTSHITDESLDRERLVIDLVELFQRACRALPARAARATPVPGNSPLAPAAPAVGPGRNRRERRR